MARSKTEIKSEITKSFMANEKLASVYGFVTGTSFDSAFSLVSFENILFDLFSFILFVQDQIFDKHKQEVSDIITNDKAHTLSWYRNKARLFQYGFPLLKDSDLFNNTGRTEEEIEKSKIIKRSAVTKNEGQLLIKIATENGSVLSPLNTQQKSSFDAYIDEIADCGVDYRVVNSLPDILILNMEIYRDPLVLNDKGMSISNANYPVEEAILEYMKALPFNGELVLFDLETKLKSIEGVVIPNIITADYKAIKFGTEAVYNEPQRIDVKTVPVSGYFTVQDFKEIKYVV
jgi:hypothetical protein